MRWAIAWTVLLAIAVGGCQRSEQGVTVSDYETKRAQGMQAQKERVAKAREAAVKKPEDKAGLGRMEGDYAYDSTGKRDPFRSFILDRLKKLDGDTKGPLEEFDLSQLSVVAVVWDAPRKRALVADPSGRGYVVQEGTPIGKNEGRVIEIEDNEVVVRETYVDYVGEKTMKDIPMRVRQTQGG